MKSAGWNGTLLLLLLGRSRTLIADGPQDVSAGVHEHKASASPQENSGSTVPDTQTNTSENEMGTFFVGRRSQIMEMR